MQNTTTNYYIEWLSRYPWQTHITIRIPPTIPLAHVPRLLTTEVFRPMALYLKDRVAVAYVVHPGAPPSHPGAEPTKPHVHALALALRHNLYDHGAYITDHILQQKSTLVDHLSALHMTPYNREHHPAYVINDHLTDGAIFDIYGKNSLDLITTQGDQQK